MPDLVEGCAYPATSNPMPTKEAPHRCHRGPVRLRMPSLLDTLVLGVDVGVGASVGVSASIGAPGGCDHHEAEMDSDRAAWRGRELAGDYDHNEAEWTCLGLLRLAGHSQAFCKHNTHTPLQLYAYYRSTSKLTLYIHARLCMMISSCHHKS